MIFSFAEGLGGKILSLLRRILPVRWLSGVGHSGKIINSCSRSENLQNPSMSDIESAKNFIWEFMSDTSKSFLINVSKMTKDERLKKYNHNHEVFFDADVKDKVIIKECARLQALKN